MNNKLNTPSPVAKAARPSKNSIGRPHILDRRNARADRRAIRFV
ncbi:MAG: hypothetical protein AAFX02_00335 [Pseudomonadota bacterium]